MNAWIQQIAELTGMGRTAIDFSLSDLALMFKLPGLPWVLAAVVFFVAAAYDDTHFHQFGDQDSERTEE